jgi:hypothetical protein
MHATLAWKMACNKPSKEVLPVTVDSAWKLVSSEPESAIPDVISKLGCKQARRAIYEGPAKLTVAVFEMTSSAGAFEVLQNWRVERRTVPLQKDKYFVLVTGANDKVLAEFASAFEKAL